MVKEFNVVNKSHHGGRRGAEFGGDRFGTMGHDFQMNQQMDFWNLSSINKFIWLTCHKLLCLIIDDLYLSFNFKIGYGILCI